VETSPRPILHQKSVFGERREREDGKIEEDCTHFSFVLYTVLSFFSVLRHLAVLLLWLRMKGTSCNSMQPIIKTGTYIIHRQRMIKQQICISPELK